MYKTKNMTNAVRTSEIENHYQNFYNIQKLQDHPGPPSSHLQKSKLQKFAFMSVLVIMPLQNIITNMKEKTCQNHIYSPLNVAFPNNECNIPYMV